MSDRGYLEMESGPTQCHMGGTGDGVWIQPRMQYEPAILARSPTPDPPCPNTPPALITLAIKGIHYFY